MLFRSLMQDSLNHVAACLAAPGYSADYRASRQTQEPPPPSSADVMAQIEKLADLKDRGILTEEEFEQKKKELFGRL